ncbi:hypothetical protein [Devosia sp. CAU 1758]
MPNTARNSLSYWFIAAAFANLATAAIHVFAGTPEIMDPVLAADLPIAVQAVVDVLWHHITGMLVMAAFACLWAARQAAWRVPVFALVGGQYGLISILFLGLGFHWFASPWPMPQWILFTVMTAMMGLGARRR